MYCMHVQYGHFACAVLRMGTSANLIPVLMQGIWQADNDFCRICLDMLQE